MSASPVRIETFRDEYAADFDRLNRAWLEGNGLLEPLDEPYLRHPRQKIVEPGGEVFFALDDSGVVGTCAAVWQEPGVLEMAKLAVDPAARGRGLGRALVLAVVDYARRSGARRLVLVSSTRLKHALRLYETLGFRHREPPQNPGYVTADVFMELDLLPPGEGGQPGPDPQPAPPAAG